MGINVDAAKTKTGILTIVNAVFVVLALSGKVSASESDVVQAAVGSIFDHVLAVNAAVAVILPSVAGIFKKKA